MSSKSRTDPSGHIMSPRCSLPTRQTFLASGLQFFLTPIVWAIAGLDFLDGRKCFTLGYVVLGQKR